MQEIVINKTEIEKMAVDICAFNNDKIYVYWLDGIRVLTRFQGRYFWSALFLSEHIAHGNSDGYDSPKKAVLEALKFNENVYIFDSQEELKNWWASQD